MCGGMIKVRTRMRAKDTGPRNAFWESLKDEDFFGSSVTHLYFYGRVTVESVQTLRSQVFDATRTRTENRVNTDPRPIVVHVHSPGGDVRGMALFAAMMDHVTVPLCVMVDGMSASAATALSVMAPYRVATEYSMTMIHDYAGGSDGPRDMILTTTDQIEKFREHLKAMYLHNTSFGPDELEDLLHRDVFLDAKVCLAKGVYDRILFSGHARGRSRHAMPHEFSNDAVFLKTNWNRFVYSCDAAAPQAFDALLAFAENTKPIVMYFPGKGTCTDENISLVMIGRILASKASVYAIVDGDVSWWQFLPVLFCHKRVMYDTAVIVSALTYDKAWGRKLADIVHNTETFREMFKTAFKSNRVDPAVLKDLFERPSIMTAADCKRLGLIDEVAVMSAKRTVRHRGSSKT